MIIVDASAIVDALLGREVVAMRLRQHELHAPVTIDAEVLHSLLNNIWREKLTHEAAGYAVRAFRAISIERHPVQHLVERMWALRHNITAYDAGYVALAESMNVPLLTRDGRLSRASGHAARIEYIE
ncbi:MAG TPA: type II toxin-antitoxin system VapC family toxin [Thermoanaerobaculia bacterium]|jgi:predicted nucleic acid-binding protein|nr:type II toxin-antitoxin system VapC family toxin [Thermoanaerobaculia bacterium]